MRRRTKESNATHAKRTDGSRANELVDLQADLPLKFLPDWFEIFRVKNVLNDDVAVIPELGYRLI